MCPSVHVRDTERGMRDKGWVKKEKEEEEGGGTGRGRTESARERDRQKRRTGDSRWE